MTEGTRWHFVAFITVLVALHFFLRVGLGLGWAVPDLLVVAVLLSARRVRGGWAAGLGVLLGILAVVGALFRERRVSAGLRRELARLAPASLPEPVREP